MSETTSATGSGWSKRHTLVALCSVAMIICYLDRVNISIAAISMQEDLGWTNQQMGWVFSAFFWGYFLMQIGGGILANKFGGKRVLMYAVILWSLFTILTPAAALMSIPALLATRLLLGLGEAGLSPSSVTLFGKWIPASERSRAVAIFSSAAILGTIIALITAPKIIVAYGWPAVFYIYGALGFIWAVGWHFYAHESPATHPRISAAEKELIEANTQQSEPEQQIPWAQILNKKAIWALFVTYFSLSWGLYVFLSWLPKYFHDAHGLNINSSGLYSMFPWISMFVMIIVAGWIADNMIKRGSSITFVRKLMQSIGLFIPAIMMLLLRDVGSAEMALFLLCISLGFLAFGYSGSAPNAIDLSPRFAGVVFGIANTFGTLAGALGGIIVGEILDRTGSYDLVFLVTAIIQIIGGVVYVLFATGETIIE